MKLSYTQQQLRPDYRAQLLHQLAALERAGIPSLQAITTLRQQSTHAPRRMTLKPAQIDYWLSLLRGGLSYSEAARRSKVLLPWESQVLAIAEHSGRRELFLKRLGDHHALIASAGRKLKARLMYPYAILFMALLLAPLPALLLGHIDGIGYLWRSIVPMLALVFIQFFSLAAYRRWRAGLQNLPDCLLIPYLRRQQRRDALALLALLLRAGVAAQDAIKLMLEQWGNSARKSFLARRLRSALQNLKQGASIAAALQAADLVEAQQGEMINSGELAGRTEEMLDHVVAGLDRTLSEQLDTAAEWLPRFFYVLIVGWVVSAIL